MTEGYETIVCTSGQKILYVPPKNTLEDEKHPALIWVHGGAWNSGSAETYLTHMQYFAQRGFVNFSVEYRLLGKGAKDITDCMADVRSAVRFIRSHAEEYKIAKGRIAAVGESAGGHLVTALAGIDGFDNGEDDLSVSPVPDIIINCNGVVDLTGKFMNFVPPSENPMALAERLSPMYNIASGHPPILNLQGRRDKTVPWQVTAAYHEKLLAAGTDSRLIVWEDAAHAFIVPDWTATKEQIDRALAAIDGYLQEKL